MPHLCGHRRVRSVSLELSRRAPVQQEGYVRRIALARAQSIHAHQMDRLDDSQARLHVECETRAADLEAEPGELVALHDSLGVEQGANRADEINDGQLLRGRAAARCAAGREVLRVVHACSDDCRREVERQRRFAAGSGGGTWRTDCLCASQPAQSTGR
jgi:hypothetical protein